MRLRILGIAAAVIVGACAVTLAALAFRHGPAAPPTPVKLARQISCVGYHRETPTLFADAEATCTLGLHQSQLDIVTFVSDQQRDRWVKAAYALGTGTVMVGDRWAITTDAANVTVIEHATGGKVAA